ncbi:MULTISPECIES: hypothetical protein [unclassified Leeuwenhoekiella]|uniref:hypothetical protein n=1 Tax=unclassified Leeuwenhoekiella TaxID=2615029 RepID=UPI000C3BB4B4|nr:MULTISPECIES: hypothetical protein [unclassified Leeuwenhoekiella]MAW95189.1 hypothetical protein [Leeuwenhoekiella sp.]MBA81888.1 hypothetical protein [Leeuwenhoekiella sp.]|tara:strand:- start:43559 stop:44410 length:852 start_codon:yes stop_codon:yes gene_type:complete
MISQATYRILCEVQVFHRYFLDDGETIFDQDTAFKTARLKKYDWSQFAFASPTSDTRHKLMNHRLFYKNTALGFKIFVEALAQNPDATIYRPVIDLDEDLQLDFMVVTTDALFGNYSNLDEVTRYPLVFRNYNDLLDPSLPLINTASEAIVASDYAINEDLQKQVFVDYQKDRINQATALISLRMRGQGTGRNLILVNGNLPQELPVFNIRFENRRTIWNYYSGRDKSLIHTTDPDTKPLTQNGIIEVSQGNTDYPAASPENIIWERDSGGNLLKTYSKIYIN